MKWFKHYSDASNDEELAMVVSEFGSDGYMFYWRVLETISSQMQPHTPQTSLTYSWKIWAQKIGLSQQKMKKIYNFLTTKFDKSSDNVRTKSLLFLKKLDKSLRIDCPNLLSIKDNHFKNLQVTGNKLASKEVEVEVDKDIPPLIPPRGDVGGGMPKTDSSSQRTTPLKSDTLPQQPTDRSAVAAQAEEQNLSTLQSLPQPYMALLKQQSKSLLPANDILDGQGDYLSASFSPNYQQILDLWKSERSKVDLATGLIGKNSRTGALKLAVAVDNSEVTFEQIQQAIRNLLDDPEKRETYSLSGLANNFDVWLGKTSNEQKTIQLNHTNKTTFYSGVCTSCNYSTVGANRGTAICPRCKSQIELKGEV